MSVLIGTRIAPAGTSIGLRARTPEPVTEGGRFESVNERLVRIAVDGCVWIKRGSVIAYHGDLRFHREQVLQPERVSASSGPIRGAIEREAVPLVQAVGRGSLYVSDEGRQNHVMRLEGETLHVMSPNLLAFEPAIAHQAAMLGGIGLLSGGLFAIRLTGTGRLALSHHGDPLTLRVTPDNPISADPTAVIAWADGLWPVLKTDLEARSLLAHGGGEPVQMRFSGDGYVVVHARNRSEAMRAGVLGHVRSKIARLLA